MYNLGTDEAVTVDDSIATITSHRGVTPEVEKTGGAGDSPLIHLDRAKVQGLGWRPELSICPAIARALGWFDTVAYIFDADQEATVR